MKEYRERLSTNYDGSVEIRAPSSFGESLRMEESVVDQTILNTKKESKQEKRDCVVSDEKFSAFITWVRVETLSLPYPIAD